MEEGVCLKRELKKYQCCKLNKNGIIIYTMETGVTSQRDERLSYGSYMMTIFVGNMYIGHSNNITLWGPLTLTQLNSMNVVIEIPEHQFTTYGDKENYNE